MTRHVRGLGRAATAALAFCLVWASAGAHAQNKEVDMELLRRAGDIYWQAQRCRVEDTALQAYFARTTQLIAASPKTTAKDKTMEVWSEYQLHVMCRNQQDCAGPKLTPEACPTFVPKFRNMRINQPNWRIEEGLR